MRIFFLLVITTLTMFASGIKWEKDYSSGVKMAKALNKPMFFVISSHTCRFCIIYDKSSLSNPKVAEKLNRDFVNVIAYVDDNVPFPDDLYVGGTPATWFIAPNGEPMFQPLMGAIEPEKLQKALDLVKVEHTKAIKSKIK